MPIGKVRRRRSWLSCSASSAMALPSSGGASVMVGASFIGFLLAPSRMLAQRVPHGEPGERRCYSGRSPFARSNIPSSATIAMRPTMKPPAPTPKACCRPAQQAPGGSTDGHQHERNQAAYGEHRIPAGRRRSSKRPALGGVQRRSLWSGRGVNRSRRYAARCRSRRNWKNSTPSRRRRFIICGLRTISPTIEAIFGARK